MTMSVSLDELLGQWQKQPDERTALSICEELTRSGQRALIEDVGKRLCTIHASSAKVLVAVARMYLAVGLLGDAQGLLVAAGKSDPKSGDVYRWLGEVLLRRGDAARAAKVLELAESLGRNDEELAFWRHQADAHVPLQKLGGTQAVVSALDQVLPQAPSAHWAASSNGIAAPLGAADKAPSGSTEVTTVWRETPSPFQQSPSAGALRKQIEPLPPPPRSQRLGVEAPVSKTPRGSGPPPLPKQSAPPAPPPLPPIGLALPAFELAGSGPSPLAEAASVLGRRPSTRPPPRDLLDVLASTGVYDPAGASSVGWDAPPRARTRFSVTLLVLTALLVGAGTGVLLWVRDQRMKRAVQAREVDAEVTTLLRGGKVTDLAAADEKLSRSFDLDPNNPTTSLLWVRSRVLRSVEAGGEEQGMDSAMTRARQAMVPEKDLAFARVGSFLAQNDTAGAIALLPQWDALAKDDPYFQLLAGAALERAGDFRAFERFELATKLDPGLVPAHVMLARAFVLEGDRGRGADLVRAIRAQWPDRAEGPALVALLWARDAGRGPAPPELDQTKSRSAELPLALAAVPSAIEALQAAEKGHSAEVRTALEKGLLAAGTPGMATWLGTLALQMDEDALARRAALQAVSFSAVYPPARILAARVALAQGRIDEATTAVGELDPALPDVVVVRAAAAYERLDPTALDLALAALSPELRTRPELAALVKAADVLRGARQLDAAKLRALAAPEAVWGDLIAVDAALDNGNLVVAKEIIDRYRTGKDRPSRALRRARYLRYNEQLSEADSASAVALGLLSARALSERVLVLLAGGHADDARSLLVKNAPVFGPMASWISAYIDAEGPRAAEARARAALLEPPAPSAPLSLRILTALALSDLGDRRRGADAVRALAKDFPRNPDVLLAAKRLRR